MLSRISRRMRRRSSAISTAVAAASSPLCPPASVAAGQRLLEVLGGEHAEDDRHAGVELRPAGCPAAHSPAT